MCAFLFKVMIEFAIWFMQALPQPMKQSHYYTQITNMHELTHTHIDKSPEFKFGKWPAYTRILCFANGSSCLVYWLHPLLTLVKTVFITHKILGRDGAGGRQFLDQWIFGIILYTLFGQRTACCWTVLEHFCELESNIYTCNEKWELNREM